MKSIITPEYLMSGDTIGIIAPARKVIEAEMIPFTETMKERGFQVTYGSHLFGSYHQYSGSKEERVYDLHKMFLDPDVKAVFCARGGYGSAQLFSNIEWEIITQNPKWLVGFSDATALHSALSKFMETLHAIMPISLVMDEAQDGDSIEYLLKALQGEDIEYKSTHTEYNFPGIVRAPVIGGNLSVLHSLSGTRYEPDYEGKILFLEDLDEYLYHLDRMVLNFELREVFQKLAGLIVGDFSDMHDNQVPFGKQAYEILAEKAHKYKLPALFGFPAGHKKMNLPLIFGRVSTLTIKGEDNSLSMY